MDEQTGDFFLPQDSEQLMEPSNAPIIMPPPVEDGYEFAGGEAQEVSGDDIFFAGPPADNAAVLVPPPPAEYAPPPTDADPFGAPVLVSHEAAVVEEDAEEKEISPMAKWNQEWQVTLKERKEEENTTKAKLAETAAKEMEEFHAQRQIKRDTKMAKNRADEQQKLEAMEADLENDNSWQRVNKMVDFQQDESGNDVTRMRDVMLTLKNDTEKAAALA